MKEKERVCAESVDVNVKYIFLVEVQRVRAQVQYRETRIGINERIVE